MTENNRNGFHTVKEPDMREYKQKIRAHRLKILRRTTVILTLLLLVIVGTWLFVTLRHYDAYEVTSTLERSDTEAARYEEFENNILKYSNDGAIYTDWNNELIWNQAYEMSNPQIDICDEYLVIYDKRGMLIHIFTEEGLQGSIETTMPIDQVCVASQGTVAVLMRKDADGYLALYDRKGKNLAQGEIHGEKTGYPVAIALSQDAVKLGVSMLDINEGKVKSTVVFYNYGSVGQNEIDRIVGVNSFDDLVIPEIEFITNDKMVAFGDTEILIFEGAQKPQLKQEIPMEKEIKSIFYNESYIGIVTDNEDETVTHRVTVYNTEGKTIMEKDFSMAYSDIEFLSNDEICIRDTYACDIYTIRGTYKFHYEFDQELYKIIPDKSILSYMFVLNDAIERVRLK